MDRQETHTVGASPARECTESLTDVDVLRAVFTNLAVGVIVCDASGKFVFFNPEATRILGIGARDVSPGQWSAVYGCYRPDTVTPCPPEQLPLARAMRGEETRHELIFVRNSRQPAGVWIDVSARPLRDGADRLHGGVVVFSDVSLPEDMLRNNTTVSPPAMPPWNSFNPTGLGGVAERFTRFRQMYKQLCRAVEQIADAILITNNQGSIEYVNPAFEQTTGYSAAEVLGRTPKVLKSGKHDAQFYRDLWGQLLSGQTFRGTIINRKKSGQLYWAEQTISPIRDDSGAVTHFVSVLKDVTTLKERREHECRMQLAREVQQRYYNIAVSLPGFDVAAAAFPADQTGGDYFDFLPRRDGSLCIVIADIAGHGFGSAFIMAETRATLRAYATVAPDLSSVLKRVNRSLVCSLGGNRFVTMVLGRIDPRKRSLEYASAGHEPGYVLRRSGEVSAVIESTAPPLGLFPDQEFYSAPAIPLEPGDTLVLLTDGVTESMNPRGVPFGASAALDFIRRNPESNAADLARGLYEAVRAHASGEAQLDDITSVLCRVLPRT